MAMTLVEASKLTSGTVVQNAVIEMFARSNEMLRILPFRDIPGGSLEYKQEGALPGVAFRAINAAFDESIGVINSQVETLRIAGGDLDVDMSILKRHGDGVRAQHEMMKVKALALMIGKKMIYGDSQANPLEFDGLRNRITGSQLIAAGATANGTPLSLLKLDEAIDAVAEPTHIICGYALRRRFTQAARDVDVGGHIEWTKDEFGRQVATYAGLPIVTPDYDELGARVFNFNEPATSGTDTATSLYVVSVGEGKLVGLQNGVMDVRDLGEIDAKPVKRTRVDWDVGLAALHGRCAARLWSISDAAFTK